MRRGNSKLEATGGVNPKTRLLADAAARFASRPSGFQSGFSLVEVTIAIGIAVVCLVALFGLSATGLNSNTAALEQTAAAGFARAIAADVFASGTNSISPIYGIPLASGSCAFYLAEDGSATAIDSGPDLSAPSRYRASVVMAAPTAGQRLATTARILITWPALADPSPGTPPKNFAGSLEILTALDRN